MTMISAFRVLLAKLRGLTRSEQPDSEFNDEMREHLTLLAERYVSRGMSPGDAALAARRQFGNEGLLEQDRREMKTFPSLENLWRDVRYGSRQLRANPLFTAVAVLSLAMGVGANTAVFTLLDQLVLRLLPVAEPERIVMIWSTEPLPFSKEGQRVSSYPMYQDFERRAEAFDFVFCRYPQQVAMGFGGSTERVDAELVSGNYFQALRVEPARGRVFSPEADDRIYKGQPAVVLSHSWWENRFAGDPRIVGRKILVNNYPMEVVGVAAAGFVGLDPSRSPDLWLPIQMKPIMTPGQDDLGNRRAHWVQMFARMKPGYTIQSARASLEPLFHQILRQELKEPELRTLSRYERERFLKRTTVVETAATGYSGMRQRYSTALCVLMGMAAVMLLIACANVASLLIARAATRQKEMAVRLAIGAGRKSLIRQLLVESLLLSLLSAAAGLVLSVVTTRALLHLIPGSATLMLHAAPDPRILAFSAAVALFTTLLFGLAPAVQGTRPDVAATLKNAGSALTGSGNSAILRRALVAAQVTLSFLLLVGAGLFAKTLSNLKNIHSGFQDIEHLATFQVDPAKLGYSVPRIRTFYQAMLREITATPGVQSAAYSVVPVFQGSHFGQNVGVEGHAIKDGEEIQTHWNIVSPGYWKTTGIRLLEGRDFDERDRFEKIDAGQMPDAAIVNRKFAEHYFGKRTAVGRRIGKPGESDSALRVRIVGVVENSLYDGPRQGLPQEVFYPHSEAPVPLRAYFYVRTTGNTAAVFPALRQIVRKLDSSMPVDDMKLLRTQFDETLGTERLIASLSVVFGALATLLAALGLYGVMAFVVVRRTKEIGLRMALGAPQRAVLWLVLREGLVLMSVGLIAGIPIYYALSRYLASELFGLTPTDAWTAGGSIAILGLVAAFAGFVPARRASGIDPLAALRCE